MEAEALEGLALEAEAVVGILFVSALAAWGVTWVVRGWIEARHRRRNQKAPPTWHWPLRIVAVVTGALAGLSLGGWPVGFWLGIGSGSLTTTVVGLVKRRLKARGAADG